MKPNILFTYITPFHPERGGIGRVTHSLTLELHRRGYNVFYLIYNSAITIKYEYDYPAPLTYLPSSDLLSAENVDFYHQYLKTNAIDIVINQSGNFDDSRLWVNTGDKKIKVISVLHSNPWIAYQHLWSSDVFPLKDNTFLEHLKRIARILLYPKIKYRFRNSRIRQFEQLLPNTDLVCMLSEKYFAELSEICPGYEWKYRAIANPNSYSSNDLSETHCPKEKIVLFIGLFGPPKREERLIKIWRHLYKDYPDWKLVLVGDGKKQHVEYLRKLAKGMPNVEFKGFQNPLPYYQRASIFCLTSNYEGWGMVLTEAMQCGTVPIAFESFASATDIIHNGQDGMLVTPFSLKQYEKVLRKLMDSPTLLHQMSEKAKQTVKRFDVGVIVDQWENLFNECLQSKNETTSHRC